MMRGRRSFIGGCEHVWEDEECCPNCIVRLVPARDRTDALAIVGGAVGGVSLREAAYEHRNQDECRLAPVPQWIPDEQLIVRDDEYLGFVKWMEREFPYPKPAARPKPRCPGCSRAGHYLLKSSGLCSRCNVRRHLARCLNCGDVADPGRSFCPICRLREMVGEAESQKG